MGRIYALWRMAEEGQTSDHATATHDDQWLTVADVAGHIGAQEGTVRTWIREGELPDSKFGSRIGYQIRRREYEAFLRRHSLVGAITRQLLVTAPRE